MHVPLGSVALPTEGTAVTPLALSLRWGGFPTSLEYSDAFLLMKVRGGHADGPVTQARLVGERRSQWGEAVGEQMILQVSAWGSSAADREDPNSDTIPTIERYQSKGKLMSWFHRWIPPVT